MTPETLSAVEFQELIEEAKRALIESDEISARFKETRRNHWKNLAGAGFEGLLQDRNLALSYLKHSERNHRVVALEILSDHWKPDADFAAICEEMLFHDPDPVVRGVAVGVLCKCYRESKDARVGRLVASMIRDESETDRMRSSAYFGLFTIAGGPAESLPAPDFRFPRDVNWAFVDSFLKEEKSLV